MSAYDRAFGVEFEFGTHIRSASKYRLMESILQDEGLGDFVVGYDGTEFEVKTPILKGANGWKKVKKFLSILDSNEIGGYVTDADGLHVHHDAPEFVDNGPLVLKLVENWVENQDNALRMVHPRRNNNYHCPRWSTYDVQDLRRLVQDNRQPNSSGNRKNLNIRSLFRHGTIEFRAHEGTLDYDEVLSWVRFGQAFLDTTLREEGIESESVPELLKNIRVSRFANRFMSAKSERMSQINARAYSRAW